MYITSLGYIWLDRKAKDSIYIYIYIYPVIKTAIKDIQRQSSKEKMRENALISLNKSGGKTCVLCNVI
jgi:hypothetical protein